MTQAGRIHLPSDEAGVTPVIGTIFILAITVVGMTAIILLGTPVIQNLQDQAGLRTMEGQFGQVRHAVQTLTIPGASKAPGITLPGGSASITTGDWFQFTVGEDAGNTLCDFHVTGLEDGTPSSDTSLFLYLPATCRVLDPVNCSITLLNVVPIVSATKSCFQAFVVGTSSTTAIGLSVNFVPSTTGCPAGAAICYPVTLAQALGGQDWIFRLTNGGTTNYGEAFFLHTQQIRWLSANGHADATFENGAIFATSGSSAFLESDPFWTEAATGDSTTSPDVFLLRFPALAGNPSGSISGTDSHSVLLGLSDSTVRTSATAYLLRIDFKGIIAGQWCNGIVIRDGLQNLPFALSTGRQFQYAADPIFGCTNGDGTYKVRSVTYKTSLNDAFAIQLVHARLTAAFQI